MAQAISKKFHFDAGHRILGLKHGKEDTMHGHTWVLEVKLINETANVFDTNILKELVLPIIDRLDHSYILWEEDPLINDFKSIAKKGGFEEKIIIINENPTLEGVLRYLYTEITKLLNIDECEFKLHLKLSISKTLSAEYN